APARRRADRRGMSTIIDSKTIAELVGSAFVAGLGVTILFALAIVGITRFAEARRNESAAAALYAVVAGVALAACLAATALGATAVEHRIGAQVRSAGVEIGCRGPIATFAQLFAGLACTGFRRACARPRGL